jgi:hypothetical protein
MTSGCRAWLSWVLAAETPTSSGSPVASESTCSFEPGLPRSTGFGPVNSPPFRPDAGRVDNRCGPVHIPGGAVQVQDRPVQLGPHSRLGPGPEPAMRGRRGHPKRRRQVPPRTPGGEHIHDRGEHRPVI